MVNRSRSAILALAGGAVLSFALAGGALASSNPAGSGQPSVECGDEGATLEPHGFLTVGFAKAELVYAGGENSKSADNVHAVSQYDVACFQFSSRH